jgi:glycogen operon protein
MLLGGDTIQSMGPQGERIVGNTILILMNADPRPMEFVLPDIEWGERWEVVVDTRAAEPPQQHVRTEAGSTYSMIDRSVVVMRLVTAEARESVA